MVAPELTSVSFDAGNGNLTLFFNTLVAAATLDTASVRLQSSGNASSANTSLIGLSGVYNSLKAQGNTSALQVVLRATDFAKVVLSDIGKSFNTTFVALGAGAVLSNLEVASVAVSPQSAKMADAYYPDTLPPFFSYYSLNMDNGLFNITFSEPVDQSSFSLQGLAFQGSRNMKIATAQNNQLCALQDSGATVLGYSNYGRTAVVDLGVINTNCIKEQVGLCIAQPTCFLSAFAPFVNDTNANMLSLVAFDALHGVQPSRYVPDFNSPYLLNWDVDMGRGAFMLVFSETVHVSYFNFTGITLTNNVGTSFRVMNPTNTTMVPSHKVRFTLSKAQFHEMQHLSHFFKADTNSYLVLDQGIVVDTSAAQHKYASVTATAASPMRVRTYYPDVLPPQLVAFDFDVSNGIITLYFSETMAVQTMQVQYLTFQSAASVTVGTEVIILNSTVVQLITTTDTDTVKFQLLPSAQSVISRCLYFAKATEFTFVAVRRYFGTDTATPPNPIEQITTDKALKASSLVPDQSLPYLVSWTADMQANLIELTFSKPINLQSVDLQEAFLSSDAMPLDSTKVLPLSDSSLLSSTVAGTLLRLHLSNDSTLFLKSATDFCTSADTCFLSFSSNFAFSAELHDIAAVPVYVVGVEALQVNVFVPDTIQPVLESFELDMNARLLSAYFSKPIVGLSAVLSKLVLSAGGASSSSIATLSEFSAVDQSIGKAVHVRLSSKDFIRIQAAYPVASNLSHSNLNVAAGFASDVFENTVLPTSSAFPAIGFVEDRISPRLLSVYLDVTAKTNISFVFSELVATSSFNASCLALASRAGITVPLHGAVVLTTDEWSSVVVVSVASLKSSLVSMELTKHQADTYAFITRDDCVRDASPNSNPNVAMNFFGALRDGLSVISFSLDLTTSALDLELSFPIAVSNVFPILLAVRSSTSSTQYTLTGMTSFQMLDGLSVLRIVLTAVDRVQLQRALTLQSRQSIVFAISLSAIVDINGKSLSANQVVPCAKLVVDYSYPVIDSYELDLGIGHLILHFNKDIVASTFHSFIALCSNNSYLLEPTILLPHASIIAGSSQVTSTLTLDLNNGYPLTDRENILLSYPLATSVAHTFLAALKGMVYSNTLPAQPSALVENLQPSLLTIDDVPPLLTAFALDLTRRLLVLNFSEAINVSSLLMSHLTILQDPLDPLSAHVSLGSFSIPTSMLPSPTVTVVLSSHDVDSMMLMAPALATSSLSSYISCLPGAFRDLASPIGNPNLELYYRYGLHVNDFIPDVTPPVLIEFNISIADSTLDLLFDEVVSCDSMDASKILFQPNQFMGTHSYLHVTLSNSSMCVGTTYFQHLRVIISFEDMIRIKSSVGILKSSSVAFVRLLSGAVHDVFGNANAEMVDGFALAVSRYVPDTTAPKLLAYSVSSLQTLTLFFNEPMDIGSLKVTWITLQDHISTPKHEYRLMRASLLRRDVDRMRIELNLLDDYDRIATNSFVMRNQSTTFLVMSSAAIKDTAGNNVVATVVGEAMQVGPSVLSWVLDMDKELIYLRYSSQVSTAFNLMGFVIQDAEAISTAKHSLALTTNAMAVELVPGLYQCALSAIDVHNLKLSFMLLNSSYSMPLYLSVVGNITQSTATDDFLPQLDSTIIRSSNALQVRHYFPDVTPPVCLSFSLDVNNGHLTLRFSEPVQGVSAVTSNMTLFSSYNGSFVSLVGGTATLMSQVLLRVTLPPDSLNSVKMALRRGGVLDSLVIFHGAVMDIAGNVFPGNDPDHPVLIESFIPDVSPPILVGFEVDLSSYTVVAVFDEVIDLMSFLASDFNLLNNGSFGTTSYHLQLSNYTLLDQSPSRLTAIYLDLGFLRADQFRLEAVDAMFNDISDSYLAVTAGKDVFGNSLAGSQVLQATSFVGRTAKAQLEGFDLVSQSAVLLEMTLYFSNFIDITTFRCSDIILSSAASAAAGVDVVALLDSDCTMVTTANSRVVAFTFPASKLSSTSILVQRSTTYARIVAAPSSSDVYGNELAAVSAQNALQVGPRALRTSLDMQHGVLLLVFNKDMDAVGLTNLTTIAVYSFSGKHPNMYFLQGPPSVAPYGSSIAYQDSVAFIPLNSFDLNHIKLLDVQPAKTYLVITAGSFADSTGIDLFPRNAANPLFVERLVPDTTRPRLVNMTMDMGLTRLTLVFNEPMRASSFRLSDLTFQSTVNASSISAVSYRLTGGYVESDVNKLMVQVSQDDAAQIKVTVGLLDDINHSYLSLLFGSVADFAGNYLDSIAHSAGRQIDEFVPDVVQPILQSFTLDLSESVGHLLLYFSEPVVVHDMNITSIVLQSRFASRDGVSYRLTGGTIQSPDSDVIQIDFLDSDLINMKLMAGLIRLKRSSYLVCGADLASDVSGNALVPFADGRARSCNVYIADTTAPQVLKIGLDMNTNRISFLFDEPVNISSIDATGIRMLHSRYLFDNSTSTLEYTFTSSSKVIAQSGHELALQVVVQISDEDAARVKELRFLATSKANCFFSLHPHLALDFADNQLQRIVPTMAMGCSVYVADKTAPLVLRYELDMVKATVVLQVTEPLDPDSIQLQQIVLQNVPMRRFGYSLALNESTVSSIINANGSYVVFHLSANTMLKMKENAIGAEVESSLLSWTAYFAKDYAGNVLPPAYDASVHMASPRSADLLVADRLPPNLVKWFVDRSNMSLVLVFDEPVSVVNASQLVLVSKGNTVSRYIVGIGSVVSYSAHHTKASIQLTDRCKGSAASCPSGLFVALKDVALSWQLSVSTGNSDIVDLAVPANALTTAVVDEGAPGEFNLSRSLVLCSRSSSPLRC